MDDLCSLFRYSLAAGLLAGAAACTPDAPSLAASIEGNFGQSGRRSVDLARAVPQPWHRVCIFGPYSDNDTVQSTLGFKWDSAKVSDIRQNEGITLLVFVGADDQVAAFANHPRRTGDFSNLSGQCHARRDARFKQVDRPLQGWAGLFHRDDAAGPENPAGQ